MTRRVAKIIVFHLIEALALVLALVAVGCGVALWRLSTGPVDLAAVTDDLETALATAFRADLVSIGAARAEWSDRSRSLVIVLDDVAVARADGGLVAQAPLVEASLNPLALLAGRLTFSRLALEGGVAHLMRDAAGTVSFGVGAEPEVGDVVRPAAPQPATTETAAAPVSKPERADPDTSASAVGAEAGQSPPALNHQSAGLATLIAVLEQPSQRFGELGAVRLRHARLMVRDEVIGVSAEVDIETLDILRDEDEVTLSGDGVVIAQGARAPVGLRARLNTMAGAGVVDAEVRDLRLHKLAVPDGALAGLADVDAPARLALSAAIARGQGVRSLEVQLDVEPGQVRGSDGGFALDGARVRARVSPDARQIELTEVSLASEAASFRGSGALDLDAFAAGGATPAAFSLDLRDLQFTIEPFFAGPAAVERLSARGSLVAGARRIDVDELRVGLGAAGLEARGAAALRTLDDGRILPDVRVEGTFDGDVAVSRILSLWPQQFALGARDFVERAVEAGRVTGGALDIDLTAEQLRDQDLDAGGLDVSFSFDDATVRFVSTLSAVEGAKGVGRLKDNSFAIEMSSATLRGMPLTDGFVDIPRLAPKGALARFGATTRADAQTVLEFIDEPPLNLASPYGVVPSAFKGLGDITVVIERPMRTIVPVSEMGFDIKGVFTDVVAPTAHRSLQMTADSVVLEADETRLTAQSEGAKLGPTPAQVTWIEDFGGEGPSSQVKIGIDVDSAFFDALGLPSRAFFDGRAQVQLETRGRGMQIAEARVVADVQGADLVLPGTSWRKDAGIPGSAAFSVMQRDDGGYVLSDLSAQTQDLSLTGSAQVGPHGGLESVHLERMQIGRIADVSAKLVRTPDDGLEIDVVGARLDARGAVAQLASGGGGGDLGAPMRVRAQFDEAVVDADVLLRDVRLDLDHTGARVAAMSFSGLGPNGEVTARIAPDLEAADGSRRVTAAAPDAGLALRVLFGMNQVTGGQLSVTGRLPALDAPRDSAGEVTLVVNDFIVGQAPVFAQILSLGSLRGLADTLAGGGIQFATLEAPVSFVAGRYTLGEARVSGPALGVTVSGEIDLASRALALEGVLVPAYTFNAMLGELPVVGDLLISRKGEGVFGLTYSVTGPMAQTRVFVNPLSALAPGVLRRVFEGVNTEPASPAATTSPAQDAPGPAPAPPEGG